jgi:hypothetical protein
VNDHRATRSAATVDQIIESVKAIATDLSEMPETLARMTTADAEVSARIADRLSEECAEVAMMLRAFATSGGAERCAQCGYLAARCACLSGPLRTSRSAQ